jgi:predicted nuclease of predicted toxin-antitoxin system
MRFIFDQNMERRLADWLRNLGHNVTVVSVDYPAGIEDSVVLDHAFQQFPVTG